MRVLTFPDNQRAVRNPYCDLLYGNMKGFGVTVEGFTPRRALFGEYDVFHLHWPQYYLTQSLMKAIIGAPAVLFLVAWRRFRGTRIIWTLHNLQTHQRYFPRAERWFGQILTRMLDGYISLNEFCECQARRLFPALQSIPGAVIPHGDYRGSYPATVSKADARRHFGIDADEMLLLFFGTISPYKNVPHLIRTFRQARLKDSILFIAGHPGIQEERRVKDAAAGDRRVKLHLERIPAEEVQMFFAAADLVVLPFTEIVNSGSVILALSFNRPVLVPAQGALPEVQARVGSEWVYTYNGEFSAENLISGVEWAKKTARGTRTNLADFDWRDIARDTFATYCVVVNREISRSTKTASN
jgi:glycosyltransferase involved in cell wall biosynthesis